ncbi:MAG: PAS domain S-box-containing protein [Hyphomicrobiaceae bacterium]
MSEPNSDLAPLERKLALQALIARLATVFVRLNSRDVDQGIVDALAQIAKFLDVDRIGVLRVHDKATRITLTHEWHRPMLEPLSGGLRDLPLASFPDTTAWLATGTARTVQLDDTPNAPDTDVANTIVHAGLRSVSFLPVQTDNRFAGAVAFGWRESDRSLNHDETVLLELVGTMVRNVVQRRRTENELRASEARFRTLRQSRMVGISLGRRDGTMVDTNEISTERMGLDPADLAVGRSKWTDLLFNPTDVTYANQLQDLEMQGYTKPSRVELRRSDGGRVPILLSLVAVSDSDEADFMAITIDLTEREKIEAALRYRNDFDALVAKLSAQVVGAATTEIDEVICKALTEIGTFHKVDQCSFFNVSHDLKTISVSHHWYGDSGDSSAEIEVLRDIPASAFSWWLKRMGAGTTIYIADVDDLTDAAATQRAFLQERNIGTLIAVPMMVNRQVRGFMTLAMIGRTKPWTAEALSSLRLLGDLLAHALERQRLDEAMREANERLEDSVRARTIQLETSNQELAAFSYSVSHDLQAPLRSIDGYSELLLQGEGAALDQEARRLLERVRAATTRMRELIEALLQVSKLAQASVSWQEFDLSQEAARILENLKMVDPDRQVETDIMPGLTTRGEPTLLALVFENLIGNAWKFTAKHESARIEVGVTETNGDQVFYVRDDGAGFDPKFSKKLFGTFERLHQVHEFEGHGIGLATVERIVKRHGGRVWAEGAVEKGATFYFTIAAPPAEPA